MTVIASAKLEHLVELVGDEDHRRALVRELAQRGEQLVDLVRHEHGGRLVEDEDPGAAVEHLEDLDALLLADAEIGDQLVGVDVEAVLRRPARGSAGARPAMSRSIGVPGSSPSTMFSHTVRLSASMKCWNTMPMPAAIASRRRAEVLLHAVDDDRALVGPVRAVERLHQRRLAGAVLADDGVDRAGAHGQVDAVVGDDSGEALDDVRAARWRSACSIVTSPMGRSLPIGDCSSQQTATRASHGRNDGGARRAGRASHVT